MVRPSFSLGIHSLCAKRFARTVPFATLLLALAVCPISFAQDHVVPDALKPWEDWVRWDDELSRAPTTYRNASERIAIWPTTLTLTTQPTFGSWDVSVEVFAEAWLRLPGSTVLWPTQVKVGEQPIPVVERNGHPAVLLQPGRHELTGQFQWDAMPQRIAVPREIGILSLSVNDATIPIPRWDADGNVWLTSIRAEESEKDVLAAQIYRVIVDGIPTLLLTEIEITVSGKNREENLGWVLPQGFQLSTINSPIPVAVDEQGRMKAQVRAGKWTIAFTGFRAQNLSEIQYASDSQPIVDRELIAFRAKPDFRLAEVEGLKTIDVTQTTFPEKWRNLPVYSWQTNASFQVTEKMRGMGLQRPEGLSIERQFWLDEEGKQLTFQDRIRGQMQQMWRLDAARGNQLGAVRIDGQGQLINENPESGRQGVELRRRNLDLTAIGRIEQTSPIAATGWEADVDSLSATFVLPPGWRALAVFGADRVDGDWLTAWSLLDLFLLLIFTMAVYRLWGLPAGVVAFVAYGLAYHEPGSPRWTWLFLLMPLALLRVVPDGFSKRLIQTWRYVATGLLIVNLLPFVAHQVQTAIFPQLEIPGVNYTGRRMFATLQSSYQHSAEVADMAYESRELVQEKLSDASQGRAATLQTSNLKYDPATRIQTGPAQPQWSWNVVRCEWAGPVSAKQQIRPILLSMQMHRMLTVIRVLLIMLLVAVVLGARKLRWPSAKATATATSAVVACLFLFASPPPTMAQDFPDEQMLQTLRKRLLEPADVYPHAADIAHVTLNVEAGRVRMEAEVHATIDVAVPLPGKLPIWSPVFITIDDQPARLVSRREGYLWVVVPSGVHKIVTESLLPDISEWEWTFELKPRLVNVVAPGWTVTGIGRNRVPDQQLLFSRQRPASDAAAYDQKDFNPIIAVNRHLEIGLVWQVRTVVTRLSSDSKAVSLKIPLLPNERVLTSNTRVENGLADVSLSAGQKQYTWSSLLPVAQDITLHASEAAAWVERWHLVLSPVWNMSQSGLSPVFETQQENMVPVWRPWPGELATLKFSKPKAAIGDSLTVQKVEQTVAMRQRTSTLKLNVECSIGRDFIIGLPPETIVTSLKHDGQAIPVRRDEVGVIVNARPGRQIMEVAWKSGEPIATVTTTSDVTLPVEGYNVTTVMQVPDSRWVLWADGPMLGPAVRFWVILVIAVLIAIVLGSIPKSPLNRIEWVLLAIGLTQVHVAAALLVVTWLFALSRRGTDCGDNMNRWAFNLMQVGILVLTFVALGILVIVVGQGLLGHPDMFIVGNSSTRTYLHWYQPRIGTSLPVASVISVSVYFYRLLMLFWALWLATALLRWLQWGWSQFSSGGLWKRKPRLITEAGVETS